MVWLAVCIPILLITLRDISYADALVSLLSLQTALFAAFGQSAGSMIPITNALTGEGVCIMIFALGGYMVHKSKYKKAEWRRGDDDTHTCGG